MNSCHVLYVYVQLLKAVKVKIAKKAKVSRALS